jgi:NDP-4-keto-2,6-dideoxyhexose 3-C-methyltransferase
VFGKADKRAAEQRDRPVGKVRFSPNQSGLTVEFARQEWSPAEAKPASRKFHKLLGHKGDKYVMMKDVCVARKTCRICGSGDLRRVIDLGNQYIASAFVAGEASDTLQHTYPLEVVRCAAADGCGLVQLLHTVAPSVLYADYGYRSGINESMRKNLRDIVAKVEALVSPKKGDLIIDIGCNDGTLLESYEVKELDKLGFDPATNVVEAARAKGLEVVNDFFSINAFKKARPGRKARVVTSIAMFYDLEEPCRFVADVAGILADDGVWVIELSYLPFMLQKNSFDTICHEHLEYYALRQIEWMLDRENLQVHTLEFNDVNGGSFRLFIRKKTVQLTEQHAAQLKDIRQKEQNMGLQTDRPYEQFRAASTKVGEDLKKLLSELKSAGKKVYAYGASTKGNTILQFCGLNGQTVQKAADRNPDKFGRHTLGTNIPIVSEEQARAEKPDYFLVLPWHFFDGFVKREEEFLKRGGKFILPMPEVRVVGLNDL